MSKIHLELLDEKRQKVFLDLSLFKDEGYLTGGTALALQINHRKSEDFDVFINKSINNDFRLKIKKVFGNVIFSLDTGDQINFTTFNGIKITFLWYYFPAINPLVQTQSISLASIEDIASDKAITVGRRAIWRDYVDLFYLLKEKIFDLKKIIDLAKNKFKGEFVETQFLEQLSYFGDLKIMPIEYVGEAHSPKEIKSFLEKQVSSYVKTRI
ncbi:nucleotidyl transferase AbiEii/AbiGii toxin family protein [Patescibacteria group bacterium]|nr:nucleotidyl transferase AbiEii/AbiGii toxin family protein [Patescibacteria group bacterium]